MITDKQPKVDIAAAAKNIVDGIHRQGQMTHAGVAITAVAILDVQLERCLKRAMRPSKSMYEQFFESFRPLNTFFSKIAMAYALRIITKDGYDELEKIRKIRNAFAHSSDLLHFESDSIAPLLAKLKRPPQSKATKPAMVFLECAGVIDKALNDYLIQTQGPPT